jgi:hypothetical protein
MEKIDMNKNVRTYITNQSSEFVREIGSKYFHGFRPLARVWVVSLLLVVIVTQPSLSAFSYQREDKQTKDRKAKKVETGDRRTTEVDPKAPQGADAALIAKRESVAQQAIQKGMLGRIAATANNALRNFPNPSQFKNVNSERRNYLEQIRKLLNTGKSASKWNAAQLASFADQVDKIKAKAVQLNNDGGGGGKTCVTRCRDEYNKCMDENDCEYSFICICCSPCSLQYLGCMTNCAIPGGGAVQQIQ